MRSSSVTVAGAGGEAVAGATVAGAAGAPEGDAVEGMTHAPTDRQRPKSAICPATFLRMGRQVSQFASSGKAARTAFGLGYGPRS